MTVPAKMHPPGRRRLVRRAGGTARNGEPRPEPVVLAFCIGASLVALAAALTIGPGLAPPAVLVLPLLAGGLLLSSRRLAQLSVVLVAVLVVEIVALGVAVVRLGNLVVVLVTALAVYEFARSREETGLVGLRGDSLLVELRTRLEQQGQFPALPADWSAEAVLRPAGGGPFAGDFVVSALTEGGRQLEVALVDVSGKGVDAGTRALMLSGALGGLLGAVPIPDFLAAANNYLWRQSWEDGFATAVHVAIDLAEGVYSVGSAGHPPSAAFTAGSGRWALVEADGIALGLLPEATHERRVGRLDPGDALLLYTDGLVEVPGRDLALGIDKLLGEAERLVPRGFAGGGEVLINRVAAASTDDRGLVLIWRRR
ncbi:MAG: serine/threonine-protein phosphatase [Actinomycetota bacterium]|nr:serine/threonine-protein phosphatase [Actinomycetota bacterium]